MHGFHELLFLTQKAQKTQKLFFSTTNCTNFTNYYDIAAQYLFRIIFAFSRIFAIPFLLRGNDSLLRKTAKEPDLRENCISHGKHRNNRNLFFNNGLHGFHEFIMILRCNIVFVLFRSFGYFRDPK